MYRMRQVGQRPCGSLACLLEFALLITGPCLRKNPVSERQAADCKQDGGEGEWKETTEEQNRAGVCAPVIPALGRRTM